jgi:hypothetical protein
VQEFKLKSIATFAMVSALALAGCATQPKPLAMQDTVEVSAAVTRLDLQKRHMTVRSDAGEEFTLDVSPEVRNLPQVQVGDRVVVRYTEAIGAAIRKEGDPTAPTVDLTADRAQAGARPSASMKAMASMPVEIIAVDTTKNVVTFYDADRLVRTVPIRRPEAQEWVRQLKPGDKVLITYAQSLAVAVEPAR